MTALAFSIAPLGRAHDLPVTTLIRDLVEERQGWPRKRYLAGAALAGVALVALAVLTSPQQSIAAMVAGATVAAFLALRLVAYGIAYLARRAPHSRFVEWRMALAAIHRPGALTPSVVLSLGLGLTALVALTLIDANMRAELREAQPGVTPSFFFLDVRGADAVAIRRLREARGPGRQNQRDANDARALCAPSAAGQSKRSSRADKVAWALEGDRGVTFADKPPEGSEVVAGTWWPSDYSGPPLVSMEQEVAEGLGLHLGDTVVVNVLGRDIAAKLANLRKVNWRSFAINFVLVYSPSALKGAPYTELVSAALPSVAPDAEVKLMRAVAQQFPAVASVRVREAMESVETLLAKLALAIRAATGVALTTSVLVLAGALAANRRARLADATILEDSGRDPRAADDDVPDRIRAFGNGDGSVRRRGGNARRLLGRLAYHAVRFRLRLARCARRRRREPCDHRRARHDRRLADFKPKASGLPARIVIRKHKRATIIPAERIGLVGHP